MLDNVLQAFRKYQPYDEVTFSIFYNGVKIIVLLVRSLNHINIDL